MRNSRVVCLFLLVLFATLALPARAEQRGPFNAPPRSVRSREFDQRHLRLEFRFDWDQQEVHGRAVHTLVPFAPLKTVELDAVEMKIEKVTMITGAKSGDDGKTATKELKFRTRGGELSIDLDREHRAGEEIRLAIDYVLRRPRRGVHFVVPDEREPDQPRMVWTHSEPTGARYWFPCHDAPNDRLTSEVLVTVPAEYFVLSNGVLEGKKENADGTRTWHWVQNETHVPYLISVVAGEFEAYEQEWDGIPIVSYVPKGRLADAARSFEKTPQMVQFFSERFGYRYPWPKYTQICVDEYIMGGMEHTSATTLKLGTLHDDRAHLDVQSDGLVSHELVHQWFGDLITCKDFGELWLNESFATYFATVWFEHAKGEDEAAWRRWKEAEEYFAEDKDRYRRALVTCRYEQPGNMFDRHSYPKGARVLHMLRFVLGEEPFWKAIGHYCRKHAFGVAETADFRTAIEEATGQGLNWFFDEWVHHGGHPEFHVGYRWDGREKTVRLTVKQTQKVDELTPLFRMPVEIGLVTSKGTAIRRVTVSKAEETFHFALEERPRRVTFDPDDWILKKLTFDKPTEEWLDQLAHDEHVMCRVRAVHALADVAHDEDVGAALIRAAGGDKFWAVRQEAVKALAKCKGDAVRKALIRAVQKDPKSDVRREAIKSLGGFAHDETRAALRQVIKNDRSYFAIAEAVKALAKVDRQRCRPDLLAALEMPSHEDVILRGAADALADTDDAEALKKLLAMLDAPSPPNRRKAVMNAVARLGKGDPAVLSALKGQLDDARSLLRRAAVEALGKTDDPAAIDVLVAHRDKETSQRTVRLIDETVAKLREKQTELAKLRKQLEQLQKANRALQDRVQKLEAAGKP